MQAYTHKVVRVHTNEGVREEEVPIDSRVLSWEKRFVELLLQRETHSDGEAWFVPAQDGRSVHEVRPTEDVGLFTCTCPSFTQEQYTDRYGFAVCKHILLQEFVSRCTRWHPTPDGFSGLLTPESTDALWLELKRPARGESTVWELRVSDGVRTVRHSVPSWLASELRGWYVGNATWLNVEYHARKRSA